MQMRCGTAVVCAAIVLIATASIASAQRRADRGAELANRLSAARAELLDVGHWTSTENGGRFYLQFRPNGTYTYTHIDSDRVMRAQQAGAFSLRFSDRKEDDWPGVLGPGPDDRRGKGLRLTLQPGAIQVPGSDPPGLPGDEAADYRLRFIVEGDPGASATRGFDMLLMSEEPNGEFGRLRFTPGP